MRITTNQDPLSPIWTESSTTHQPPPHRGRSPSPKKTPLSSSSAGGATINLINADAVQSNTFHAHHHLPSPTDSIPSDPILYLPPLLSPLPVSVGTSSTGPLADFETRLPNIDPGSLALHQALHFFRPRNEGYASTPYHEAFNWDELVSLSSLITVGVKIAAGVKLMKQCLPRDITREWYGVVFRSRRHLDSSSLSLYKADREAHEEAVKNGGLVMYWYGVPDSTGMNLATCIWQR